MLAGVLIKSRQRDPKYKIDDFSYLISLLIETFLLAAPLPVPKPFPGLFFYCVLNRCLLKGFDNSADSAFVKDP